MSIIKNDLYILFAYMDNDNKNDPYNVGFFMEKKNHYYYYSALKKKEKEK